MDELGPSLQMNYFTALSLEPTVIMRRDQKRTLLSGGRISESNLVDNPTTCWMHHCIENYFIVISFITELPGLLLHWSANKIKIEISLKVEIWRNFFLFSLNLCDFAILKLWDLISHTLAYIWYFASQKILFFSLYQFL